MWWQMFMLGDDAISFSGICFRHSVGWGRMGAAPGVKVP